MSDLTAELCDTFGVDAAVCLVQFATFGAHPRFSGLIRTVSVERDNGLVRSLLAQPGEGAVLIIDGAGHRDCALVGDVLARLGIENGWSGLVINGAVRDTAALSQLEFGIKALAANPRPPERLGAGVVDEPVEFGGVRFRCGDLLVSDEDGIVVLHR